MRTKKIIIALLGICLTYCLSLAPANGQTTDKSTVPTRSSSVVEKMKGRAEFEKRFPGIPRTMARRSSQLRPVSSKSKAYRPKLVATTSDGTELWGNVLYTEDESMDGGMYKFNASSPIHYNEISSDHVGVLARGSGSYYDGIYHYIDYEDFYDGYVYVEYGEYDTDSWNRLSSREIDGRVDFIATDVTYDATTGKTYGCYYNADMNGYEICAVDYSTLTRTVLATAPQQYVAMAANKQGVVYAIGVDGNLYTINKQNGEQTLVGSTGVTPSSYIQSAAIDQNTGKCYWTAVDNADNSALYQVDLTTGHATQIATLPGNEEIGSLYVPLKALGGAPATVKNLKTDFGNGSNTGTVSFTMPGETVDGTALSGDLNWYIIVNNDTVKSGTASPNSSVAEQLTVADGEAKIKVVTSNSVGFSDEAKTSVWVGYDEPSAVSNVKLTYYKTSGNATLTWNAPTTTVNGGYMGDISYTIVRNPGKDTVATKQTETTFTEHLSPDTLTAYTYDVIPYNGAKEGAAAKSNKVIVGNALNVPYSQTFDDESSFDLFTTVDANNDGYVWEYSDYRNAAYLKYNSSKASDDWLITPPLNLKANSRYILTFTAKSSSNRYPEKVAVSYGIGTQPSAYVEVLPTTTITSTDGVVFKEYLTPEVSGQYSIGFHGVSDADQYGLAIDDISVVDGPGFASPDSVYNFTITPGERGSLKATLTFNAPKTTVDKSQLDDIEKIEVYRNDSVLVSTINNPAPGSLQTVEDNTPVNGFNTYSVLAYNAAGAGTKQTKEVFIGYDSPLAPDTVVLKEANGKLNLKWDATSEKGVNGGYVDTEAVRYNIFSLSDNSQSAIKGGESGTEYTFDSPLAENEQDLLTYGVSAVFNNAQSSIKKSNSLLVGKPYTLPIVENFTNEQVSHFWWMEQTGYTGFQLIETGNGDNGSVAWSAMNENDEATFNSGKISLAGTDNPKLVFSSISQAGANVQLYVEAVLKDGTVRQLDEIDMRDRTTNNWQISLVDLNSLKNEDYFVLRFRAVGKDYGVVVAIDDITMFNVLDNDLTASLRCPSEGVAGQESEYTVSVANIGQNVASGYNVELYANGKKVDSVSGDDLESFGTKNYSLHYTEPVNKADELNVYAKVSYDIDNNQANNTSDTVNILISQPTYPTIDDLQASSNKNGVTLTWTAPETESGVTTDEFENYTPWTTDKFGLWTCVDGDGAPTYAINGVPFPHATEPYAFIVFKPTDLGFESTDQYYGSYSGEQYLASFSPVADKALSGADDWLISPTLSGNEQQISFFAKSIADDYPESFEIRYSTEGTDTASFKNVVKSESAVPGTWTEYTAELPAGATHFAIHVNTKNGFALFIDDIKYESGAMEIKGFTIYRDGEKIGTANADDDYFDDLNPDNGQHVYNVTVNYGIGESAYSNDASVIVDAIKELSADGNPVVKAGENSIIVDGKQQVEVYLPSGALVYKGSGKNIIPAKQGLYLIRINGKTEYITIK